MSHPFLLFASDVDGTLMGQPEASDRFFQSWTALHPGNRPLLVYNTGRTIEDTYRLITSRRLPEPDFVIGSLGTTIHSQLYNVEAGFRQRLGPGWNLSMVEQLIGATPGIQPQPVEMQNRFKSSWYWDHASSADVASLSARLRQAGVAARVVYSCKRFLDILPAAAGKGNALVWLCQRFGIAMERVLIAGDTANDRDMFELPDVRGIVVGNALLELYSVASSPAFYHAKAEIADGVIEGLQHYGVISPASP